MSLTFEDMENKGFIKELAECFSEQPEAIALLAKLGIKEVQFPSFNSMTPEQWWRLVCKKFALGKVEDGLKRLIDAAMAEYPFNPVFKNYQEEGGAKNELELILRGAADTYPGKSLFKEYQSDQSRPDNRGDIAGIVELVLPGNLSDDLILKIIDLILARAGAMGGRAVLNLGRSGSSRFNFSVDGIPPEQIDRLAREIEQACANLGVQARVTREPYTFRDYYSDPLTAEGPDGQRFALEQIRASTPVKDIARGVMNSYKDEVWPTTKTGQRQQAVIDRVTPEGTVRLDPRQTLHDAGVRPGDTLQVSPERTAGAVDPLMREEALARVRVQVLDHAAANPGFEVEANSLVAPTEYLFRFRAPSFAPPWYPGEPPRPIERHEVLVELPPDFPIEAPLAWWQTEIFHPNIHPENGRVCLGDLQENYQPGLDFGELCKMLVDIAAYRSYAFEKGYFDEAAAKWALSEEGQLAIEQAGGFSLIRRLVEAGQPQQPLRIRRIDR